jgi:two-component system OmpR family response regulator/two-component system response regulator RstA
MQVNNPVEPISSDIKSLVVGRLSLNRGSRVVSVDDREVMLTAGEYEVLVYLAARAGQVVSRDELFQKVLGMEYNGLDRTVDLRVSRLRRKLGDPVENPRLIKSIRSEGYFLAPDVGE